jgi:hypothetical protein
LRFLPERVQNLSCLSPHVRKDKLLLLLLLLLLPPIARCMIGGNGPREVELCEDEPSAPNKTLIMVMIVMMIVAMIMRVKTGIIYVTNLIIMMMMMIIL